MAHTPGPWTIAWEDDDGEPFDNGVRIDAQEGPVAFNVIDCSAILIAAAPELLAALRLVKAELIDPYVEHYPGDDIDEDIAKAIDAAVAAIAKAEGRTDDQ